MAKNSIKDIQEVFGPEWQPSSTFTSELQEKGIYGAVRIKGTPEVYTLGPGGGYVGEKKFQELFGTAEQAGIVGEVSAEEARRLGIRAPGTEPLFPTQPEVLTPEMLTGGEGEVVTATADTGEVPGTKVIDETAGYEARQRALEDEIQAGRDKAAAKLEADEKEKARLEEEKEPFYKKWKGLLLDPVSKTEEMEKAYAELGIDPAAYLIELKTGYDEIGSMRITYNEILGDMGIKIDAKEQLGMPQGYIQGQKALVERQYNSRLSTISANIGAKAAILEAKQGLMSQARTFAMDAVDAAIWNYTTEVNNLTAFLGYNEEKIAQLGTDIQDALNQILTDKQTELAEVKADKNEVMGWVLDAAKYGIDLGVDINTVTRDEAFEIYTQKLSKMTPEDEYLSVADAKSLGIPYGTTIKQARAMGITPRAADGGFRDFTDSEKRKLEQAGIDWKTTEGYKQAGEYLYGGKSEEGDWINAETYITNSIQDEATNKELMGKQSSAEMLRIFSKLKRNTKLSDSDLKTLMATYGMVFNSYIGTWTYIPLPSATPVTPASEEEIKKEGGFWSGVWSDLRQKLISPLE